MDYNQEGISHKTEYVQMFQDCGWEYLQDLCGYSYFRKPMSEMHEQEEEIFCDDRSRVDMMKRVFKGRMIPLMIIFFGIILPQLYLQSHLGGALSDALAETFAVIGIIYLVLFVWFGYQFLGYWKLSHK